MKPDGGSVDAEGCYRQGAESDGNTDTAEGDDRCAGALQNDEDEAGGGEEPGSPVVRNGSRGAASKSGSLSEGPSVPQLIDVSGLLLKA